MATIYEVSRIIRRIADGIEKETADCMDSNRALVRECTQEQMYSGQDGDGRLISPTYDNDPYFSQEGPWQGKAKQYKEWKQRITPPVGSQLLHLPPRPVEVPNIFITGAFHESVTVKATKDGLEMFTDGFIDGNDIVRKYGDNILALGPTARRYLIMNRLRPWLERFFVNCGYK